MQPSGPTPRSRAIQRGRGQFKEWGAWAGGCDVVEEAPGSPIVPRGEPRLWANSSVSFLKNIKFMSVFWSFPGGARSKETTCQCRIHKRPGFHPWVGKIPCRRAWQPTPVFLPGESHGQRSLAGYSPWSHKESGKTEVTLHTRSRRKTSSKPGF